MKQDQSEKQTIRKFTKNGTSLENAPHSKILMLLIFVDTRCQSYKHFTLINYYSRVVIWGIFQLGYDPRVVIYERRGFIRLGTDDPTKTLGRNKAKP